MSTIQDVFAVVMAGGRGTRLHPLTLKRSKPAVPIAGKYRLIDIPISNCINSGIHRIAVLTQYNSASLHRHLSNAYQQVLHGSLEILAATQTPDSEDWYQGTADAMRKQLAEISTEGAEYTLILAGDHVYRMDYEEMAKFHIEKKADITVAVHPAGRADASRLGIVQCDPDGRVLSFIEKPSTPEIQRKYISRNDPAEPFLGSMGIYIFNTKTMIDLLTDHPDYVDFGCDVLPAAIQSLRVFGYQFNDYWEDIGTIRAYYEANMAYTQPDPPFAFYSMEFPIYSHSFPLPSSKVVDSELTDVILAEGCEIHGAKISHSVIGLKSQISRGVRIEASVLLGVDQHCPGAENTSIPIGIGENSFIEGAIVDRNARIGKNVIIRPFPQGVELDGGSWFVCDGIVVIPKDAEIPDGSVLAPDLPIAYPITLKDSTSLRVNVIPGGEPVTRPVPRFGGQNAR